MERLQADFSKPQARAGSLAIAKFHIQVIKAAVWAAKHNFPVSQSFGFKGRMTAGDGSTRTCKPKETKTTVWKKQTWPPTPTGPCPLVPSPKTRQRWRQSWLAEQQPCQCQPEEHEGSAHWSLTWVAKCSGRQRAAHPSKEKWHFLLQTDKQYCMLMYLKAPGTWRQHHGPPWSRSWLQLSGSSHRPSWRSTWIAWKWFHRPVPHSPKAGCRFQVAKQWPRSSWFWPGLQKTLRTLSKLKNTNHHKPGGDSLKEPGPKPISSPGFSSTASSVAFSR